ncbi:hypothetical protein Hypma_007340 [Hypsizygus marmoreus]|uniref:Uncharacterized protein n=1 Tax=Hypsizygus marmoreus TaxID=39966 RepID=A0A369JZ00_HYPMA|nr:hypothetical protein Hypma_007340 [Hypsizygus marmoreus]
MAGSFLKFNNDGPAFDFTRSFQTMIHVQPLEILTNRSQPKHVFSTHKPQIAQSDSQEIKLSNGSGNHGVENINNSIALSADHFET